MLPYILYKETLNNYKYEIPVQLKQTHFWKVQGLCENTSILMQPPQAPKIVSEWGMLSKTVVGDAGLSAKMWHVTFDVCQRFAFITLNTWL